MEKIIVQVYVPAIEDKFDIFIPQTKKIKTTINLLSQAINEITEGSYSKTPTTLLYNKKTGISYDITKTIKEAGIVNGTQLILY